jgi:murein DD-endopeptidase MepM/ murein hydrolase activator NlpD
MENYLSEYQARYAIGGYGELRTMYSRSHVFDAGHPGEETRRLHLGMDIWGMAGTTVFCPVGGMVHSFAMNNADGDYGATLILLHQLEGVSFYTLYGHISEADLSLSPGDYVNHGQELAHFGEQKENGNWPPHLHFQVIMDMELREGDYPGVCRYSERDKYLSNCPDPDLILQLNRFIK